MVGGCTLGALAAAGIDGDPVLVLAEATAPVVAMTCPALEQSPKSPPTPCKVESCVCA